MYQLKGMSRILIAIGSRATNSTLCIAVAMRAEADRFPIVMYTGHAFVSPEKFVRWVASDMKIMIIGITVSPSSSKVCIAVSTP